MHVLQVIVFGNEPLKIRVEPNDPGAWFMNPPFDPMERNAQKDEHVLGCTVDLVLCCLDGRHADGARHARQSCAAATRTT